MSFPEDTDAHRFATEEVGEEITVLAEPGPLVADVFPQGLSPRELAVTLKGQLLGHFFLQEFIGGGGMGAVFKALDTTLDRVVAVKVVASQSISSEDLQRRFLVEAQSTARLDHPNIARIHFVGRDRGLPYIVFEYIDGANLRDLVVNHGPIPVGDALSYTCQIAHALAHAWQKEVVHRDIKPSNILINREGQAKLVDMGLARLQQVDAVEKDLTNTGVTLGTFDYISPEQARDPREADTRSDIYSLGCTLFYMLAGRPPFADGTAVQKLLQHQEQVPAHLTHLRPEIPESISQLVSRMLAKSPSERPQNPGEVVASCHAIFQELGLQPPTPLVPTKLASPRASVATWYRHLPWAIPLCVLSIVAAVRMASSVAPADVVEFPPLRRPHSTTVTEKKKHEVLPPLDVLKPLSTAITSPGRFPNQVTAEHVQSGRGSQEDWESAAVQAPAPASFLDFPQAIPIADESMTNEDEWTLDLEKIFLDK